MSLLEKARKSDFKRFKNGDLAVEHAVIIWTNFAGAPTRFNPAGGKRTFALVLTEDIANELKAEGWNVKFRDPKDPDDDPLIYTEIVVNMDSAYPPSVVLYSEFGGRKKSNSLDAESIGELDRIEIDNVDLVIHPYVHGRPGPHSTKGYAKAIHVIQGQDGYFGAKYAEWGNDSE